MSAIKHQFVKGGTGVAGVFQSLKARTQFVVIAPTEEALFELMEHQLAWDDEIDPEKLSTINIQQLKTP